MPITTQQALDCFLSDDLIGIGMEADAVRRTLHPEGVVTYAIQAHVSTEAEAVKALDHAATGLILHLPTQPLAAHVEAIRHFSTRFPAITLQALSAPELLTLAHTESIPLADCLTQLRHAGLHSISGASDAQLPTAAWLELHRAAHHAGLRSQALLVFGAGESDAQRVAHLEAIRTLHAETAGFTSFTAHAAPAPNGRELDEATAVEFLKTLAISRIVLDNLDNIEADARTQGLKVLQMALRFGANDAGPVALTGLASEEEIRRIIRDAGFQPAQRNPLYTACLLP